MSRNRIEEITICFHFNKPKDADLRTDEVEDYVLSQIKVVFAESTIFSSSLYNPHQFLSLDEATCPFKGRCRFKTYNPNKPDPYGIKSYALCESNTGYTLKLELATSGQRIFDIVTRFVENYKYKNHVVFMDNFYNKDDVQEALLKDKINSSGTL